MVYYNVFYIHGHLKITRGPWATALWFKKLHLGCKKTDSFVVYSVFWWALVRAVAHNVTHLSSDGGGT